MHQCAVSEGGRLPGSNMSGCRGRTQAACLNPTQSTSACLPQQTNKILNVQGAAYQPTTDYVSTYHYLLLVLFADIKTTNIEQSPDAIRTQLRRLIGAKPTVASTCLRAKIHPDRQACLRSTGDCRTNASLEHKRKNVTLWQFAA